MALMDSITKGKQKKPRRIMLYGTAGIGKTTWASKAPKPIFVKTEDGADNVDCASFPLSTSYLDVITSLDELITEKHEYKSMALDSLDQLERLIWDQLIQDRPTGDKGIKVENIEDYGYAKGVNYYVLPYWRDILHQFDRLRDRGMHVIIIAHASIEKFRSPETDDYDRYTPRIHKTASAIVREWCDEVLFASYKIYTDTTDGGFGKKIAKGTGGEERIMRTTERATHVAKNRLGLPDVLPLTWAAYAEHAKEGAK